MSPKISNMAKYALSAKNSATEMEFGLPNGKKNDEHNGVSGDIFNSCNAWPTFSWQRPICQNVLRSKTSACYDDQLGRTKSVLRAIYFYFYYTLSKTKCTEDATAPFC